MILTEEEKENQKKEKNSKIKKIIIVTIVLLVLLGIVIGIILVYKLSNPTTVTIKVDGVTVYGYTDIVDFQTDAYGETELYFKIRKFADVLTAAEQQNTNITYISNSTYTTSNGDYSQKTEDNTMCYALREGCEVAIFTENSNVIYKKNLENNDSGEYKEYNIDKVVFSEDDTLYASQEGIEVGYNTLISYDEKTKTIEIKTLDYIIYSYENYIANLPEDLNYGTLTVYDKNIESCKCVFDGLLIVQSSKTKQYGIISVEDLSTYILEPKYDSISFSSDSSTFVVKSDGKYGLFSEDGKRKIDMVYDNITSMGENSGLYMVETNKMYGVVDENGNVLIHPEYDAVGISVSSYSYNGVKNGYILLDSVIPVQLDGMWALFDKSGNMITDGFIYKQIGCSSVKSGNNIYPLLLIEEYNAIIVEDENESYCCIDPNGEELLSQGFVFEQMYLQITSGVTSYKMTYRGKDYDIVNYIKL